MRILPVLVTFALLLAVDQAAHGQFIGCPGPVPGAPVAVGQAARGHWSGEKLYVVECRVVTASAQGKNEVQLGPSLTLAAGRKAVINDVTETPIVASVARRRGGEEPRITVLKEGTTIELVVYDEGDGFVTLDALIETSKISGLTEKEAGNGRRRQCARLTGQRVRVLELAALGEEFSVPLLSTSSADGKSGEGQSRSGEAQSRSGEAQSRSGEGQSRSGEAQSRSGEAQSRSVEFTIHTPDMPRHWYSESETRAAARRKSWLWQMWMVVLRTMAAA